MAGAIAQRLLDKVLDWSEGAVVTLISGTSLSFSDMLLVLGVIIGGILIGLGMWQSRREKQIEKVPIVKEKTSPFKWITGKIRKSKKPKYDFTLFDDSFKAVQDTPEPKAKARMLDYFQPELRSLCYDYQWDEVKDRIQKVLEYIIPKTLSNDPNVVSYLQYLAMIINRYSEHTIDVVREKWLKELETMYDDPKYETNCSFLGMLQELHAYSVDYMIKLIDHSVTRWSDARFQSLAPNIEFWELKRRDKANHQIILQYLRGKMSDAEKNKDNKAFERLKFLYGRARG